MLRMLMSGMFLLALMLPSAGAQDFEARYGSAGNLHADRLATRELAEFVNIVSNAGWFDLASAAIERHLSRNPLDGEAQLLAAQIHERLGSDELAAQHAGHALKSGFLDDTQMRRAAFLRAAIKRRTDPLVTPEGEFHGKRHADPVATASLNMASRDRLTAAPDGPVVDESVLRRIYGATARIADPMARIAGAAQTGPGGMASRHALPADGSVYAAYSPSEVGAMHHAYQEADSIEADNVAASVPSQIDFSLRYTFALY